MKRILTFTLVLAVLVALPFSIHAKEWSTVGTNPTTTSIVETMKKMDFDTAVVRFVQQNFPDTTYVMKGMIFNQASQGDAKIQNNVTIGFDSTKALVWRTGDLDVYYVLECNNVLWKAACTESQTIAPAPEESPAPVVTPATTNDAGSFFADWFTKLLKIGLGALLARGTYRSSAPTLESSPAWVGVDDNGCYSSCTTGSNNSYCPAGSAD
ncbi:MAG: hypothetical protein COT25_01660 [Candidatus Kerfeldbacteria bacterium CG08_land_8_20_14_0_20_42_7]|uniref:Uncharacterized protein n=1 Tax=Candidatus Kerfeldbacteria bacterium CG08_land_8_20_14_0_20_42_7 TaxID=2014245 RepID=A0A2H0YTD0_9BACT|nr:MAG: hypothetical protein COT25_01660 [Candidatus Kerfeldbacteria bacterium CG08_land_8_20_14_0_20_42_7]